MIAAQRLTPEQARSLLPVLGALLAAYGFFYTSVKDTIAAAESDWGAFRSKRDIRPALRKASSARNTLIVLAVAAVVVAALFVSVGVDIVADIRLGSAYSPEKAALLLVEVFWAGLAAVMVGRAIEMLSQVHKGKEKEQSLPDT